VTKKINHLPHLFVTEGSFPCRHSRGIDAVPNNPFQLTILVVLHIFRGKRGHRRRHFVGERHTCGLTIQPMTNAAVMTKVFSTFRDVCLRRWYWIEVVFPSNRNLVLHFLCHFAFYLTGFVHAAADE